MNDLIAQAVRDILTVCHPQKILLYNEKRTLSTGKLKALSLCIIVPNGTNCRQLRTNLYLAISVDISVSLNVYPADEWQTLLFEHSSYAAWIARKGQVVYESET